MVKLAKKDRTMAHRVMKHIQRLSDGFPNKPEKWERIKTCRDVSLFELKPKPYRVAVLVWNNFCLCLHLWKVEKGSSRRKQTEIEKACVKAREVKDDFVSFIRGV